MSAATNEQEVVEAVLEWVQEQCPAIAGAYDYAPADKPQGLPDVVVEVELAQTVTNDERFPYGQLQQILLRVFDVTVSIMVDNSGPQAAATALRGFSATLHEQALADCTLGGRVFLTANQIESDFVPQFVQYEDGTRGRQVVVRLVVAHPVETA